MFKVIHFAVDGSEKNPLIDHQDPYFSFALDCGGTPLLITEATLKVNGVNFDVKGQVSCRYQGPDFQADRAYEATLQFVSDKGERLEAVLPFRTGKFHGAWQGDFISDASYHFKEKRVSPKVLMFRKDFATKAKVKEAFLYASALGIYDLELNGQRLGDRYFAPGFTSYQHQLQYQYYDVLPFLKSHNTLLASVAGGWAVGSYLFTRKNRHDGKRPAFLMELHLRYEDGQEEVLGSDSSFGVSEEGPVQMADFYDGETFDSRIDPLKIAYHPATREKLRFTPHLFADYSCPVIANQTLKPLHQYVGPRGETIYDFGQNFAGVVSFELEAQGDETVTISHAEVLRKDGGLDVAPLRSAQARITYHAHPGHQSFSPRLTYMGFRYVAVSGIRSDHIKLSALALSSDLPLIGSFACSNAALNRLHENMLWSARSNFMDIPTDCPQRDERMGWTGDIALFASTAAFVFDTDRFLRKWLKDLRSEQLRSGGLPNTIPNQGYGFPTTMPKMAVDFWGDAALYVPFSLYLAYGDREVLSLSYESMKRYVDACAFWAKIWGVGKYRYIWHTPSSLHFGDWVAPDTPTMAGWQKRSPYTATAALAHSSALLAQAAGLLGKNSDQKHYAALAKKVAEAYDHVFFDGEGKMKKKEFQTGYVLPLAFDLLPKTEKEKAAENLARLVEGRGDTIGTGFPATPYVLFALADHGHADVAFRMLMNEKCPSWLYAVKMGATTIWEKFDGLDEEGYCRKSEDGTDGMISFNHYASGSVCRFLHERIGGLTALEPGYRHFQVKPLLGGAISSCQIEHCSPYGPIVSSWKLEGKHFSLDVTVPYLSQGEIVLPSGKHFSQPQGSAHYEEELA